MEKSEAEAKLREERARAQAAQERLEEELEAALKELETAQERETSVRASEYIQRFASRKGPLIGKKPQM